MGFQLTRDEIAAVVCCKKWGVENILLKVKERVRYNCKVYHEMFSNGEFEKYAENHKTLKQKRRNL